MTSVACLHAPAAPALPPSGSCRQHRDCMYAICVPTHRETPEAEHGARPGEELDERLSTPRIKALAPLSLRFPPCTLCVWSP